MTPCQRAVLFVLASTTVFMERICTAGTTLYKLQKASYLKGLHTKPVVDWYCKGTVK